MTETILFTRLPINAGKSGETKGTLLDPSTRPHIILSYPRAICKMGIISGVYGELQKPIKARLIAVLSWKSPHFSPQSLASYLGFVVWG